MDPGFGIVPAAVIKALPQLSRSAACLAIALAKFMNRETGEARPACKTLQEVAGIRDWRTFAKARNDLATMCGLCWYGGRPGRGRTHRYFYGEIPGGERASKPQGNNLEHVRRKAVALAGRTEAMNRNKEKEKDKTVTATTKALEQIEQIVEV